MNRNNTHWDSDDEGDDLPPLEPITMYTRGPSLVATRIRSSSRRSAASSTSRSRSPSRPRLAATSEPHTDPSLPRPEPIHPPQPSRGPVFLLRESSNDQVSSITTTSERGRLEDLVDEDEDGPPGLAYVSDSTDEEMLRPVGLREPMRTLTRTRSTDDIPRLGEPGRPASPTDSEDDPMIEVGSGLSAAEAIEAWSRFAGSLEQDQNSRNQEDAGASNFVISPGLRSIRIGNPSPSPEVRAETILKEMRVLDNETLARYNRLCVAQADTDEDRERGAGCAICWETLIEQDAKAMALPCTHVFHDGCLRSWFVRATTCPECRFDLDPDKVLKRGPSFTQFESLTQMFGAISLVNSNSNRPTGSGGLPMRSRSVPRGTVRYPFIEELGRFSQVSVQEPAPGAVGDDEGGLSGSETSTQESVDSREPPEAEESSSRTRPLATTPRQSEEATRDGRPPVVPVLSFTGAQPPPVRQTAAADQPPTLAYVVPRGALTFEEMLSMKENAIGLG